MDKNFDMWFGQVRELCAERGHPLPNEIPKEQLHKWQVQFDNMLEPSEAYYNLITLAETQLGVMPNPAENS